MKGSRYLLALSCLVLPCRAADLAMVEPTVADVEELFDVDVQQRVHIFEITLDHPQYAALCFRQKSGPLTYDQTNYVHAGPAKKYRVVIFLPPEEHSEWLIVRYWLGELETKSMLKRGGQSVMVTDDVLHGAFSRIGPPLPQLATWKVGGKEFELAFESSDTPVAERDGQPGGG